MTTMLSDMLAPRYLGDVAGGSAGSGGRVKVADRSAGTRTTTGALRRSPNTPCSTHRPGASSTTRLGARPSRVPGVNDVPLGASTTTIENGGASRGATLTSRTYAAGRSAVGAGASRPRRSQEAAPTSTTTANAPNSRTGGRLGSRRGDRDAPTW